MLPYFIFWWHIYVFFLVFTYSWLLLLPARPAPSPLRAWSNLSLSVWPLSNSQPPPTSPTLSLSLPSFSFSLNTYHHLTFYIFYWCLFFIICLPPQKWKLYEGRDTVCFVDCCIPTAWNSVWHLVETQISVNRLNEWMLPKSFCNEQLNTDVYVYVYI